MYDAYSLDIKLIFDSYHSDTVLEIDLILVPYLIKCPTQKMNEWINR